MRPLSNCASFRNAGEVWPIAALRRNPAAFNHWACGLRLYVRHVSLDVVRHRAPRDLCEEVTNETFMRIWLGTDVPRRSNSGWLRGRVRVSANAVLARYGLRCRTATRLTRSEPRDCDTPYGASASVLHPLDRLCLDDVLARLRTDERELLVRVHVRDEPLARIADDLGVSKPTAHRRVLAATLRARGLLYSNAA